MGQGQFILRAGSSRGLSPEARVGVLDSPQNALHMSVRVWDVAPDPNFFGTT